MQPDSSHVIGIGLDLVHVETIRLAMHRDSGVAEAWLTVSELQALLLTGRRNVPQVLAGRVAAKEAVVKALQTGFCGEVTWQDVELTTDARGVPLVVLSGGALSVARELGVSRVLVSITHTESLAAAAAIAVR